MTRRKRQGPRPFEIVMDEAGEEAFPWNLQEHLKGCVAAYQIEPSYSAAIYFALEAIWGIARDVDIRAKTGTLPQEEVDEDWQIPCPFRKPYPGRIRRNDRIGSCSRAMFTILRLLIGALRDCIMSRGRLEAEVIVLRHQLNMLRRLSPRRVRPNAFDRAIFVCLYRHFPDIGNVLAIIRP